MLSKLKVHREDSNKELSLSNNEVQITFTKQGYVTKLLYKGKNVLEGLTGEPHDPDKNRSFYCDYHIDGKTRHMHIDQIKTIKNSDQMIHVAFIDSKSELGIEYHIILKNNDSGIY